MTSPTTRSTRPTSVPAFLMLVSLAFAIPAAAQPWVARHGLTAGQYQAAFNQYTSQGFRLTQVDGYDVNGSSRYVAIWEKEGGPAWVTHHGMTSSQYQAKFDQYTGRGYRLVLIDGHTTRSGDRYAAIWEKRGGPAWVAHHGMTSSQYQAKFNQYTSRGYRLVHVSGYGGSSARYAAIWEKRGGPAWVAHHGMTSSQYQAKFNQYARQGYRLVLVDGYRIGGVDSYVAIWERRKGPAWVARHRMTGKQYQAEFADRALQGYRLKVANGYAASNSARYAAIWEAEPDALHGSYCENGKCFDLKRFADELESSLQAGQVVKYGFEVRRGLSVIRRAQGPKRTAADPPASAFTAFDRFNPASVAKAVTAVATLRLLAANGIDVDAAIYPHLPTNWNIPASIQSITFKEVLNHTSGLRNANAGGYEYHHVKALIEHGIDPADKVAKYQNVNYALLRVLVASLDGYSAWTNNPASGTAARFIGYLNRELFAPLGIYDVECKPAATAPTLFYPPSPGNAHGTAYGDWSLKCGSAGVHNSVHELAVLGAATFQGNFFPQSMLSDMKQDGLGFGDYGTLPGGSRCWGKGGYFPGGNWNGGAELNSVIVHCDNGVTGMLVINGAPSAKTALLDAMKAAFPP